VDGISAVARNEVIVRAGDCGGTAHRPRLKTSEADTDGLESGRFKRRRWRNVIGYEPFSMRTRSAT